MLGIIVNMMIQARYPGGVEAFDKDFCTFVTPGNQLVIAPLGDATLPEEFKAGLNEMGSGMNFTPVYAGRRNFEGYEDKDEIQQLFNEYMDQELSHFSGRIMIQANQALMDITAPGISKSSEEGEELISKLSCLEYLPNLRIQFKEETYFRVPGVGEEIAPVKKARVSTWVPTRDRPIGQDDIMDLQIALGSANSVEEFLAMI
jgi:hypothetical protein